MPKSPFLLTPPEKGFPGGGSGGKGGRAQKTHSNRNPVFKGNVSFVEAICLYKCLKKLVVSRTPNEENAVFHGRVHAVVRVEFSFVGSYQVVNVGSGNGNLGRVVSGSIVQVALSKILPARVFGQGCAFNFLVDFFALKVGYFG